MDSGAWGMFVEMSKLKALISQWEKQLRSSITDESYKDAIRDCLFDLNLLMGEIKVDS